MNRTLNREIFFKRAKKRGNPSIINKIGTTKRWANYTRTKIDGQLLNRLMRLKQKDFILQ
jgi:hypothetical protein